MTKEKYCGIIKADSGGVGGWLSAAYELFFFLQRKIPDFICDFQETGTFSKCNVKQILSYITKRNRTVFSKINDFIYDFAC